MVLLICGTNWNAFAATTPLNVTFNGSTRTITVESSYIQGIPHLPLCDLTEKIGADCRVRPAQIQIDFRGVTALADMDGVRIYSSRSAFSLQHPIIRQNNVVYIELLDAQTLFKNAFEVTLSPASTQPVSRDEEPPDPSNRSEEIPEPISDIEAFEPLPELVEEPLEHIPSEFLEPLENFTDGKAHIILDPGHGGRNDTGIIGERGTVEKDVSLRLAQALQEALQGHSNIEIHLTRVEDKETPNISRASFANMQRGTVYLSLHTAGSPSATAHGIGMYYPKTRSATDAVLSGLRRGDSVNKLDKQNQLSAESRSYAEAIASALGNQVSTEQVALRGTTLQLASTVNMPMVLIEVGYLSNAAEEALLSTDAYLTTLAKGIAEGVKAVALEGPENE